MRKLIRKCQNGVNTSSIPNTLNIGAESLDIGKGLSQSALDAANAWKSVGKGGLLSGVSNFGKDIFKNMGGASGLISMGGNIVNSLLPEATQSNGLKFANNVLSFAENIPVYGKFATLAKLGINTLNTVAGHTIKSLNNDQEVQDALAGTGGGYGDFMNSWDEASKYSGKRAGFFDGHKYDRMVEDANRQMTILQSIIGRKRTDDLLTAQMADRWNERTMMDMNGGPGNISFGRLGLKVEILPRIHAILNAPKVVDTLEEWKEEGTIDSFQKGGKPKLNSKETGEDPIGYLNDGTPLYKKGDGTIGPLTKENIGKDNLFDLIKNSNANFAKRLQDPNRKYITYPDGSIGNFKLVWSEDETGTIVYPEIQEINGQLVDLSGDREKAWKSATEHKDYIYFPSKEAADWFTKNYKNYYKGLDNVSQSFKEGGKMNVIPEGSLHARLHHMENAEGLTKKGIPVVSIAEGGELEQQAEIELNEIIFNLEVTTELEKLMKDGSDNAAIEAGKLLVKEIFENTDDRTGLIKDLEPEKKESTTEDIVKNHQVFKEGGIIERINNLSPEQLEKLTKFLNEV